MNQEAGVGVDPSYVLGEVACNLEMAGVERLLPIEVNIDELLTSAKEKGYDVVDLKIPGISGTYIISANAKLGEFLFIYTDLRGAQESCPYICDRDVDDFRKCFQGIWPPKD